MKDFVMLPVLSYGDDYQPQEVTGMVIRIDRIVSCVEGEDKITDILYRDPLSEDIHLMKVDLDLEQVFRLLTEDSGRDYLNGLGDHFP